MIDTQGKSIDKFNEPIIDDHHYHHYYLEQSRDINDQSQNVDTLSFEFSICKSDVWAKLIDGLADEYEEDEDDEENNNSTLIWFTGTIDKYSGKVISATLGRTKIAQQAASDPNIQKNNGDTSN